MECKPSELVQLISKCNVIKPTYRAYKTVKSLSKSSARTPASLMGFSSEPSPEIVCFPSPVVVECLPRENMSLNVLDLSSWDLCTLNRVFSTYVYCLCGPCK